MTKGFSTSNNREVKAKKIEGILVDYLGTRIEGYKVLEVGCGSGIISAYLGKKNKAYAVDVENKMELGTGEVIFSLISNERLPFEDNSFDIVISNHVVEHVYDQFLHLSEIRRVLKSGGVFYFATPNKNFDSQSGVMAMNLYFNLPVIVSNLGGLTDVIKDKDLIFESGNFLDLEKKIRFLFEGNNLQEKRRYMETLKKNYEWNEIVNKTLEFYDK